MARIIDKGNGSYLIRVSLGRVNGKQSISSTTFRPNPRTESGRMKAASVIAGEVERFAYEYEKQVKEGKYSVGPAKDYTFERYVAEVWEENYADQKLTQRVHEDYSNTLRIHVTPYIGGFKIGAVTVDHIQEIINRAIKAGKAASTVRKIFVVCNSVFSYARRHRVIASNPCDREIIDLPTLKQMKIDVDAQEQKHIFSVEQTRRFLDYCKKPYVITVHRKSGDYTQTKEIPLQMQTFFHLAFYLGARRGELCALRWTDINWSDNTIKINKSASLTKKDGQIEKGPKTQNSVRTLVMTASCHDMLRKWHIESKGRCLTCGAEWKGYRGSDFDKGYVFIQDDGSQIDLCTPYQSLKRAITRYNESVPSSMALPSIRLHDARHTAASSQIALGVSLADASRNLGHADVTTTARIYVHGQEDSARRAAEVLEKALG